MPPKSQKTIGGKASAPATKSGTKTKGATTAKKVAVKPKEPTPAPKVEIPKHTIPVKEISKFVVDDSQDVIKDSPWWPYLIDEDDVVVRFLRHTNCNIVSGVESGALEPEKLRLGLLGALRFGKPFVFDMSPGADLYDSFKEAMDGVLPGLLDMILNKDILKEENIEKILKDSDQGDYGKIYDFSLLHSFRFVVTTSSTIPTGFTGKMMEVKIE